MNVQLGDGEKKNGIILSASFEEPLKIQNIKYKVMLKAPVYCFSSFFDEDSFLSFYSSSLVPGSGGRSLLLN